ncbi:hypothetical protein KVF89_01515 [Nocardioides carbamazepini]|uniref:hypothetical protein n=1 Tax=Nocardioides carbamazepini TaxID=2854259 RepID=UPI0021499DF9|nr:hypothetical protein [Nocardioides carbamazepini]MCR1781200.1 hypothetical protein [Nocardioides carbamazepini]
MFVAGFIAASEIGLWVLLGLGLALRYVFRRRRASTVTLALIPLLDVALVVAVAADLHRGAEAGATHGLAGIYLGFSVAFGPSIVRWADVRFAHRFADGPPPVKPPKHGPERMAALWREWFRVVLAAAIASVVLLGLVALVADGDQDGVLLDWTRPPWTLVGLWFLFGPLWELPSSRRGAQRDEEMASSRSSS